MKLCSVLAIIALLLSTGCSEISTTINTAGCTVAHSEGVDWITSPTINSDGVMRASGTLKEGYDFPRSGTIASFNFNNHEERSDRPGAPLNRLKSLGSIGPTSPRYDYPATKYDVSSQGFNLEVPIPEQLESDDIRLVFVVFGDGGEDIAAACVKWP